MLRDRTLAASRSRRATGAAILGEIFTLGSISIRNCEAAKDSAPPWRLYTIYTVMQITT